jgi:Family of unknown function (DUF6529)
MTAPAVEPRPVSTNTKLIGIFLAGAVVSVAVGVYADTHSPTGFPPFKLFFSGTLQLKSWFAVAAGVLAVAQVLLAARMYGKLHWPHDAPPWLGDAHRLTGLLAFAFTLPVAYHCLWSLGFKSTDTRVLVHSLAGCFFYGIFVVKVLSVRSKGLPGWTLPVVGGLVFAALMALVATSSLWFFTSSSAPRPIF